MSASLSLRTFAALREAPLILEMRHAKVAKDAKEEEGVKSSPKRTQVRLSGRWLGLPKEPSHEQ